MIARNYYNQTFTQRIDTWKRRIKALQERPEQTSSILKALSLLERDFSPEALEAVELELELAFKRYSQVIAYLMHSDKVRVSKLNDFLGLLYDVCEHFEHEQKDHGHSH